MYLKPLPKIVHGPTGVHMHPPPPHPLQESVIGMMLYLWTYFIKKNDVNIESTWPNYAYGALFIIDKISANPSKL